MRRNPLHGEEADRRVARTYVLLGRIYVPNGTRALCPPAVSSVRRSRVGATTRGGKVDIRILVAMEDEYRSYRGVITGGIKAVRPRTEVVSTCLEALEQNLARFEPHVVICTLPMTTSSKRAMAWVELSSDPLRPSIICMGGRRFEQRDPTFDAVLAVVDEVQEDLQSNSSGARQDLRTEQSDNLP